MFFSKRCSEKLFDTVAGARIAAAVIAFFFQTNRNFENLFFFSERRGHTAVVKKKPLASQFAARCQPRVVDRHHQDRGTHGDVHRWPERATQEDGTPCLALFQCFGHFFSSDNTPNPGLPSGPHLSGPIPDPLSLPFPPDRPKFRSFYSSPATFSVFLPLLGVLSLNFGIPGHLKCARLEFSCCRLKPPDDPQERGERMNIVAGEGKKERHFGPPTLRAPTLRGPPSGCPHPSGGGLKGVSRAPAPLWRDSWGKRLKHQFWPKSAWPKSATQMLAKVGQLRLAKIGQNFLAKVGLAKVGQAHNWPKSVKKLAKIGLAALLLLSTFSSEGKRGKCLPHTFIGHQKGFSPWQNFQECVHSTSRKSDV